MIVLKPRTIGGYDSVPARATESMTTFADSLLLMSLAILVELYTRDRKGSLASVLVKSTYHD